MVFHQSLFYGNRLDLSLINPNQLRINRTPVWDNPFDAERPLGIELTQDIFIPFETKGTKIYFKSRVPTEEELHNCTRFELTSLDTWNPEDIDMSINNVETIPRELPITNVRIAEVDTKHNITSYVYDDPTSDEAILHTIDPSLLLETFRICKV